MNLPWPSWPQTQNGGHMETMHNEQRTLMLPAPPNLDYRDAIVLRFERVWLALQMLTVRRQKEEREAKEVHDAAN